MAPARLAFGLSAASGLLQVAGWTLFMLPFYAPRSAALASGAAGAAFHVASQSDPAWVPLAMAPLVVGTIGLGLAAAALGVQGLRGRWLRPRRAGIVALLGALLLFPFAVSTAAQAYLAGLGKVVGVLALLSAVGALVAASLASSPRGRHG